MAKIEFALLASQIQERASADPELQAEINRGVHGVFRAAYAAGVTPAQMVQFLYVMVEEKRKHVL